MDHSSDFIDLIEKCFVLKLGRNIEDTAEHYEFNSRITYIEDNIQSVLDYLKMNENTLSPAIISSLYILYKDLQTDGPWNNEKCRECALKLNNYFNLLYDVNLSKIMSSSNQFDQQLIFNHCLKNINDKLSTDDFKKYPSFIAVYSTIVSEMKNYSVQVNPFLIMPVTLLLIDDYIKDNKVIGLRCCSQILQLMCPHDFDKNNYYEVIYRSLKKSINEKDHEITKLLLLECFLQLLKVLPETEKISKCDDLYCTVLEELFCESNLYRKSICFQFTKQLIEINGVNCISRKQFKSIICDNLEICTEESVSEILLLDVLKCFEEWLKYCWYDWNFITDDKILQLLLKILFVSNNDECNALIQNIISALIELCETEEKEVIAKSFQESYQTIEYLGKLEYLKKLKELMIF